MPKSALSAAERGFVKNRAPGNPDRANPVSFGALNGQKNSRVMDPAEEADRMLGTLNNVISELMSAKNKAQKHRDNLRIRGVSEDDVRAAKAELSSIAIDVQMAADGLESVSESVDE